MAAHVCFIDIPSEGLHRLHPHNNRSCRGHIEHGMSPMSSADSSPRCERNIGFFHHLSRRFGRKSSDDLVYASGNDDSYSSSPDSCCSTTSSLQPIQVSLTVSTTSSSTTHSNAAKDEQLLNKGSSSSEQLSCASSDTSSNINISEELQKQHGKNHPNADAYAGKRKLSSLSRLQRRSTSSICKVFEGISISSARSLSCSSGSTSPQQQPTKESSLPKSALKTASALELRKRTTISSTASSAVKSKSAQQPPQRILRQPVSYI